MQLPTDAIFLIINIFLFLINGSVLFYCIHRYKKSAQLEQLLYGSGSSILKEAQEKAKTIIESAIFQAKHTLSETDYIKKDLIKKIEDSLDHVAQGELALIEQQSIEIDNWYKRMYADVKNAQLKRVDQTLLSMDQQAKEQIKDFEHELSKQTVDLEKEVAKKIDAVYQQKLVELENYKKLKLDQINKTANKLVLEITEKVLGISLSNSAHEKLILDALEQAKQEGIFETF